MDFTWGPPQAGRQGPQGPQGPQGAQGPAHCLEAKTASQGVKAGKIMEDHPGYSCGIYGLRRWIMVFSGEHDRKS